MSSRDGVEFFPMSWSITSFQDNGAAVGNSGPGSRIGFEHLVFKNNMQVPANVRPLGKIRTPY